MIEDSFSAILAKGMPQFVQDSLEEERAEKDRPLWDKVAIAAMQGLISCDAFHGGLYQQNPENAAIFGADCADAFMQERAKRIKEKK